MSPLKIDLLLRMRTQLHPTFDMPPGRASAPAMRAAIADFVAIGLAHSSASELTFRLGPAPREGFLTVKGYELVERLKAVEP